MFIDSLITRVLLPFLLIGDGGLARNLLFLPKNAWAAERIIGWFMAAVSSRFIFRFETMTRRGSCWASRSVKLFLESVSRLVFHNMIWDTEMSSYLRENSFFNNKLPEYAQPVPDLVGMLRFCMKVPSPKFWHDSRPFILWRKLKEVQIGGSISFLTGKSPMDRCLNVIGSHHTVVTCGLPQPE